MRRVGWLGLLFLASAASAQEAPKPAATATPGDQCLANAPLLQQYIADLKNSRDEAERTIVTLRVQLQRLEAEKAKKP